MPGLSHGHSRSVFELAVTLVPFVAIWAVAWWTLSISIVLAFALALANAAFLVRLFIIQHDCGHGSLFRLVLQRGSGADEELFLASLPAIAA